MSALSMYYSSFMNVQHSLAVKCDIVVHGYTEDPGLRMIWPTHILGSYVVVAIAATEFLVIRVDYVR